MRTSDEKYDVKSIQYSQEGKYCRNPGDWEHWQFPEHEGSDIYMLTFTEPDKLLNECVSPQNWM